AITTKAQDCTDESVLKEPGRFLDNHTGKPLRGTNNTPAELANAKKTMTAFEQVCKKTLVFTGGRAKASFLMNTKDHYNQQTANVYMYNLGMHAFVCNVQTHKLAIVDEYMGVLRITGNPSFERAFSLDTDAPEYKNTFQSKDIYGPRINMLNYYGFGDVQIPDAVNNGTDYLDLSTENIGRQGSYVLKRTDKGYGYMFENRFVNWGIGLIYRHRYITHTDIPFFIPATRKKFLQDLLEFYEREKTYLVTRYSKDKDDIIKINEKKKAYAQNLLTTKDAGWLNQQAVVEYDNKTFIVPYDPKKYLGDIYGKFHFKEFYTGTDGLKLYNINPEYIKKYPPNGAKPSLIKIAYRYRDKDRFLLSVKDDYINKLDIEGFKKILQ
ncbi:MAG TPA: hypothetical protein VHM26_02745, partial [Chitinophagaceae bacterium]|nr:hypothetical protein [Chitinophagaceae bacterium]